MAEDGYKVSLNVYDLSQGLARQLSTTFLGKAIEGIWHTGVVVYGYEYYFGGGIQHSPVGTTPYGTPFRVVELGVTYVPKELFEEYLQEISSRYTAETYSLLTHNCNNFSNEVAQFLVGATIPDYILQLPNEVLGSPMGPLILPMIQQLETTLRSDGVPHVPQFRPSSMPTHSRAETTVDNLKIPFSSNSTRETPTSNTVESPKTNDNGMESLPDSGSAPEKLQVECEAVPLAAEMADSAGRIAVDPLGDARSRVQEEIGSEFAAIMATGTLRASEAAALATRRVMERYGRLNFTVQQG